MEKFSFYVIASIALSFAAYAHGASHPQASQDWVRAFVSNQIQRAGSGAGSCGCSSATSQGGGCGCGTGTAGCASGCSTAELEAIVSNYLAATSWTTTPDGGRSATVGRYNITFEPSTVTGIVVKTATALSEAAGFREGRILVLDPNPPDAWSRGSDWVFRNGTPGSGNLPIYSSDTNLYVCAEAGGEPIWLTDNDEAIWLLAGGPPDASTNRVCELSTVFVQPNIANMALSTNGLNMVLIDGSYLYEDDEPPRDY